MKFTKKDIEQIKDYGLTEKVVNQQISQFNDGIYYSNIHSAATVGDGIFEISYLEVDNYVKFFETKRDEISVIKFIPASGAATRMFKFLFDFLKEYNPRLQSLNAYINCQHYR